MGINPDNLFWTLDEKGEPRRCADIVEWTNSFPGKELRIVKKDTIGKSEVSTIFLSVNSQWGDGVPILWETMVFEGKLDQRCDRCTGSREQAEAMHERMVARVRAAEGVPV